VKKTFATILILSALAAFASCGAKNNPASDGDGNGDHTSDGGRLSVVATIFPLYDFTREIAGDNADITLLLPPGAEVHSYEPTPADITKIQNCDIFIYIGGESDEWVRGVLDSVGGGRTKPSEMTVIAAIDCVAPLAEEDMDETDTENGETDETDTENGETGETDTESGEADAEYDEHVWTTPRNAKLISAKIADALRAADSANAGAYTANLAAYSEKLDTLDTEFRNVTQNAVRETLIFGDRFPFLYFADEYGLDCYAAFPGCSSESEASAKTMAALIDRTREERIPVVFKIELSSGKIAEAIAEATGAKVLLLHSCQNVSREEFESGKTYTDIMTENVSALREALS